MRIKLFVTTYLIALSTYAQTDIPSIYIEKAKDHSALFIGQLEPWFISQQWATHPYWEDTKFHEGDICFEGRLYHNIKLRYNLFSNFVSVTSPEKQIAVTPDMNKISYFTIEGKYFIPFNGLYARIEYDGNRLSLIHYRKKNIAPQVIVNNTFVKNLYVSDKYYIYKGDSIFPVASKGNLIKLFPDYKKQIKDFCTKKRLSFTKRDRDNAINECAMFIDQLLCNNDNGHDMTSEGNYINSQLSKLLPPPYTQPESAKVTDAEIDKVLQTKETVRDIIAYNMYKDGGSIDSTLFVEENNTVATPGVESIDIIREAHALKEIQVIGITSKIGSAQTGMESFRPALMKNIPLALGESDIMKMAMTLPGVKSMGEASSGLNVRGSSSDQNLILYNNGIVYNPMHLFGLFSAFNADMVSETKLYKGGIPSQYGGRVSSVMDIKSKFADKNEWHAQASIGLLTSKALVEAPIIRDRVLLMLSGRTTYSDWMLKTLPSKSGYKNGSADFWDLGGSLGIILSNHHRINAYGYYSHDNFSFTREDEYSYNNGSISMEWKGQYGDNVSSSLSVGYDRYDYNNEERTYPDEASSLSFSIDEYFAKGKATISSIENNKLTIGFDGMQYNIMPGRFTPVGDQSLVSASVLNNDKANEYAVYAEDEFTHKKLTLTGGVRYNIFKSTTPGKERTYSSPDIRLSMNYAIKENQSIKGGFNTLHQFIHKVSNTAIISPTDTWILSNSRVKPQSGMQVSAGYYITTNDQQYEFGAELYYKRMSHYLTYRGGAQLTMNPKLEDDVITAQGKAYGIELQAKKMYGKLDGWISYTYSKAHLRQDDLSAALLVNGGNWYDADYDSPHEFKFVANYKFTRRFSISLNGNYFSGRPITLPTGKFYNKEEDKMIPYYTDRNASRLPDYMRMDASFNVETGHHITNKLKCWWSFGVYNILGRKNAYSIYYKSENDVLKCYRLSIFGAPIPFLSFNFKF